jgi:phage baseplate assembly protein W
MSILDFIAAAGAVIPNTVFGTSNWSLYIHNTAGVVTDEDEVNQTIKLICKTIPGSDPLRPEFGCNFLPCLDLPLLQSGPLLRARVTSALATWEKRIKVVRVDVTSRKIGILDIEIVWQYAANSAAPAQTVSFALA